MVSSFNHIFNKRQTLKSGDIAWQCSKEWYADGTFKSVGTLFIQLWSVHVFMANGELVKWMPAMFLLMSGKSADDYKSVLGHLLEQNCDMPQYVVMEFEAAVWNAFYDTVPSVNRKGCHRPYGGKYKK